jgi:hypothetical protein
MTGKDILDALASGLTILFSDGMERLFGPGVHATVLGPVSCVVPGAYLAEPAEPCNPRSTNGRG